MENNEIKEILDCLKENKNILYSNCNYLELDIADQHLLLDYITNLQKENEKLREIVENLTTMTVCGDRKQIKNTAQYKLDIAQQKIDKAIEFVEQNLEGIGYVEVSDLLHILEGEDKMIIGKINDKVLIDDLVLREEPEILRRWQDSTIEEKNKEIERLKKENNDLRKLYHRTSEHLFDMGDAELARYFQAQIDECPTFYVEPIIDYYKEYNRLNNGIDEIIKDIEHSTLLLEEGQVELKDTPFGKRILYKLKELKEGK